MPIANVVTPKEVQQRVREGDTHCFSAQLLTLVKDRAKGTITEEEYYNRMRTFVGIFNNTLPKMQNRLAYRFLVDTLNSNE